MNGRWYGHQGYPQWYPPQGYHRQGYPPQYGGYAQEGYSDNAYGYPAQGYNYPYAQPPQWMNHGPQNTYKQVGGGENNPQIQGVGKIANKGDLNMGYSSGATNNFNNQGSYAEKQIQGVNGGSVQM
ncbi:hypothetical protein CKAN_01910700 [Cinnamomum micranthum f. kanehirae]|uniref:Uncharacterized protein n=1 Tax=Cinnamomum micranthum f. kanehirae TaxID=337451 RepID=A0A3S3NDG3_9MAGN|nr:hypothetical protein CKAN_01910700 [Cinnamomum micranthum f. kanehirae]